MACVSWCGLSIIETWTQGSLWQSSAQWFSAGLTTLVWSQGTSGNVGSLFSVVTLGGWGCFWNLAIRAQGYCWGSALHRADPTTGNFPTQPSVAPMLRGLDPIPCWSWSGLHTSSLNEHVELVRWRVLVPHPNPWVRIYVPTRFFCPVRSGNRCSSNPQSPTQSSKSQTSHQNSVLKTAEVVSIASSFKIFKTFILRNDLA